MFRTIAVFACLVVAAGALGDDTCAVATESVPCTKTLAAGDHSLLQVHPASTVDAKKKTGSAGNDPPKTAETKLQQEKTIRGKNVEATDVDGTVGEGLGSESGLDPYPEDYDLDMDYPRDDKGTHADTVREVQSATLPDAGDVGRNTKPGLKDSWNVDQMFVTDSDGAGDVHVRGMIPWGYRSQAAAKKEKKNKKEKKDKSGLLSEGDKAREEQDEKASQDKDGTSSQHNKSPHKAAPKNHRKHAAAESAPASGEAKGTAPAARRCAEGQE